MTRTKSGTGKRRPLRRRAAVTTYGVGALVDFPHETLLAAGLDLWPDEPYAIPAEGGDLVLRDERLERLLGVDHFRAAPVYEEDRWSAHYKLPFLRFPTWLRCPRCHRLTQVSSTSRGTLKCENSEGLARGKDRRACAEFPKSKRFRLLPVRFLAACANGHLEDFPWSAWIHTPKGKALAPSTCCPEGGEGALYLDQPGYGGLSNIVVRCARCKGKRTLTGAGGPQGVRTLLCSGQRPWLGDKNLEREPCDRTLRMVQKGASRLHQPTLVSALLIPRSDEQSESMLRRSKLRRRLRLDDPESGPPSRDEIVYVADYEDLDPDALERAVQAHFRARENASPTPDPVDVRFEEYLTLLAGKRDSEHLVVREPNLSGLDPRLSPFVDRLLLVDRLTETQVLVGFTRLGQTPPPLEVDWKHLSRQKKPWLPAYRVHGEGVFLTLDLERVDAWTRDLRSHFETSKPAHLVRLLASPEEYLVHTLSHLLIRRLSFECGYGTSSLRERLYFHTPATPGDSRRMCGLLIYTAAGDSAGTLGGLVRQGEPENLSRIVINALEEARWCSADPLCRESPGQGPSSKNLAACHACCLLPETSCEARNQNLDRLALLEDSQRPGFFQKVLCH